jgi:hypothetical protein
MVEIIPGKGSGQLKKQVLRFLDRRSNLTGSRRLKTTADCSFISLEIATHLASEEDGAAARRGGRRRAGMIRATSCGIFAGS